MLRKLLFLALPVFAFSSCNKGDEPVSCSVSSPYAYNTGGARMAFPTAFTPNGDGRNDVFRAIGPANLTSYGFAVYDVNGNIIFQTTDPYTGWQGNYSSGVMAPAGNYVAEVQFRTVNGDAVDKHICVALLTSQAGGGCIVTNSHSYYFEDQFDPSTATPVYSTTENLCPY